MVVWPLIVGIVIVGFSVLLLSLRVIVPSFILILTGISLVIYWIYINRKKNDITDRRNDVICTCAICGHTQSSTCVREKCICCLVAKGDRIVGHTNNSLQ
jgi:hypothetical protein